MGNNLNTYTEKEMIKYVIATMDGKYLKKIPSKKEYYFVDDIEIATKTTSKKMMKQVLEYYYQDTGMNVDMVIIPVKITYELVNETN